VTFRVPDGEIEFRASRAGGPGGQHVNTSATRVEALWNVVRSHAVTEEQRARLLARLGRRVDASGTLRVVAAERRSQLQNRLAAAERLRALVADALSEPKPRKRTRPPKSAVEGRLAAKKRRAETKRRRSRIDDDS
jgi:ribosome-associated protein